MDHPLKVLGRVAFSAAFIWLLALAGGGFSFVSKLVGILSLSLTALWFFAVSIFRQTGAPSAYDRKQRIILAATSWVFVAVLVAPWEYSNFTGPLPRDGLLSYFGLAIFALGVGLQIAAMLELKERYTFRLGIQKGHRVVTSGPYALVRHPGYFGSILSLVGIGLALGSLVALASAALIIPPLVLRIRTEEGMLTKELGKEYPEYARKVRWKLFPGVY